jgi:hypothetical protein
MSRRLVAIHCSACSGAWRDRVLAEIVDAVPRPDVRVFPARWDTGEGFASVGAQSAFLPKPGLNVTLVLPAACPRHGEIDLGAHVTAMQDAVSRAKAEKKRQHLALSPEPL